MHYEYSRPCLRIARRALHRVRDRTLNVSLTIIAAMLPGHGRRLVPCEAFRWKRGTNICRSTLSNATVTAGVDLSRVRIAGAIKQAATTTGTSFEYLLATAKMESNFNPTASASTSSARGLYQFIDQTWLGTVKEAGAQLGYGKYADAITKSSSGSYSVSDPAARAAIMKLRDDPDAAPRWPAC